MSRYDFELDMEHENSLSIIIHMIKENSIVLEVGPANGRMTKYLCEKLNCRVDIIEMDLESGQEAAQYSRNAVLGQDGDVQKFIWCDKLKGCRYDYIIFADVLEHLNNPKEVLCKAKEFLNESGRVLLSVPNIAHNAILLNLMNNQFPYKKIGLLDDTHIHFFAYHDLKKMIKECGYYCIEEKATYCRPEETEFAISYEKIDQDGIKLICNKEYGNVYQFVFQIGKETGQIKESMESKACEDRSLYYTLSCYYKTKEDNEYSEKNSIKKYYIPGKNTFILELPNYKDITELRIDPMECNCVIENFQVSEYKSQRVVNVLLSNGIKQNNKYIFKTKDPMFFMDKTQTKQLWIEFETILYQNEAVDMLYEEQINEQKINEERKALYHQNEKLENEISERVEKEKSLEHEINEKNEKEKELETLLLEKEKEFETLLFAKDEMLMQQKKLIEQTREQLDMVMNSTSWKMTQPFRFLAEKCRRT